MLRDGPMRIGASSIQVTTQSMTFFLAQVLPVHQGSCSRAGRRSDHEGVAKRVTRFQVMPPIISRSQPQLPQGDYRLEGSKVTFTTKGPRGEVDYEGMISKEGILFHIHSCVTDASHNHLFVFRVVEFPTTVEPLTEGFR